MNLKDYIIITAIILVVSLFMGRCNRTTVNPVEVVEKTTVHYDTIINTVIKEYHTTDLQPQIIYIDTNTLTEVKDTSKGVKINKYADSIIDSNISLYSEHLVDGKMLKSSTWYQLRVPEITKTVHIEYRPQSLNELFLTSSVGGNKNEFNNLSLGVAFKSKKAWLVGYNYNLLNNSHNVTVGTRILKK